MLRKGLEGAKDPSEALKKEYIVQTVVIDDSFREGFYPFTCIL